MSNLEINFRDWANSRISPPNRLKGEQRGSIWIPCQKELGPGEVYDICAIVQFQGGPGREIGRLFGWVKMTASSWGRRSRSPVEKCQDLQHRTPWTWWVLSYFCAIASLLEGPSKEVGDWGGLLRGLRQLCHHNWTLASNRWIPNGRRGQASIIVRMPSLFLHLLPLYLQYRSSFFL